MPPPPDITGVFTGHLVIIAVGHWALIQTSLSLLVRSPADFSLCRFFVDERFMPTNDKTFGI